MIGESIHSFVFVQICNEPHKWTWSIGMNENSNNRGRCQIWLVFNRPIDRLLNEFGFAEAQFGKRLPFSLHSTYNLFGPFPLTRFFFFSSRSNSIQLDLFKAFNMRENIFSQFQFDCTVLRANLYLHGSNTNYCFFGVMWKGMPKIVVMNLVQNKQPKWRKNLHPNAKVYKKLYDKLNTRKITNIQVSTALNKCTERRAKGKKIDTSRTNQRAEREKNEVTLWVRAQYEII